MVCPHCGSSEIIKCPTCAGNKYKCMKCFFVGPQSRFQ